MRAVVVAAALLALLAIAHADPTAKPEETADASTPKFKPYDGALPHALLFEQFVGPLGARWTHSVARGYKGVFNVTGETDGYAGLDGDEQMVVPVAQARYAVSTPLSRPFAFETGETFVLQYEVQFQLPVSCGGAYVKLLEASPAVVPSALDGDTHYSVMFGPDVCDGKDRVHFIYRFRNPLSGEVKEHAMVPPVRAQLDRRSHVYTLVIEPDSRFRIAIDGETQREGRLDVDADFEPPLTEPPTIGDPTAVKPADWVDEPMMADPSDVRPDDWDDNAPPTIADPLAVKPDSWDESAPVTVRDPNAVAPADWDAEMDGAWLAPEVANPACELAGCGPWSPPMIDNPAFRGKWKPRQINNPAYKGIWRRPIIANPYQFKSAAPARELLPISSIGFELWTMVSGISFDNVLITTSVAEAEAALEIWRAKFAMQTTRMDIAEGRGLALFNEETMSYLMAIVLNNPLLGLTLVLLAIALPLLMCCLCCRSTPDRQLENEASESDDDVPAPATAATAATAVASDRAASHTSATRRARD